MGQGGEQRVPGGAGSVGERGDGLGLDVEQDRIGGGAVEKCEELGQGGCVSL